MSNVKFYDVKSKRAVSIPESQTKKITRKGKGKRVIKMLTAKGPKGNQLYKIVG